jgi:hypothetical protein
MVMVATNLHADNLEEARDQVCGANNVQVGHFSRFELLIFLRIDDGYFKAHRWIDAVYSSNRSFEHARVFTQAKTKHSRRMQSTFWLIQDT